MAAVVNNSAKASAQYPGVPNLSTSSFAIGGSNRVLYVLAGGVQDTPGAPTSAKWGGSGGTALTKISTDITYGTYWRMNVWRLVNPTAQTSTVYVTWPRNMNACFIIAVAVEDADQTTPNNTVAEATGANTNPTVNATSVSGNLVLDFAAIADIGASSRYITEGANQTYIQKFGAGGISVSDDAGSSKETATGTSTTMSWTRSGTIDGWGIVAFAVNGAGAGNTDITPGAGGISSSGVVPIQGHGVVVPSAIYQG